MSGVDNNGLFRVLQPFFVPKEFQKRLKGMITQAHDYLNAKELARCVKLGKSQGERAGWVVAAGRADS